MSIPLTLCAVDCVNHWLAVRALAISSDLLPAQRVLLLSDRTEPAPENVGIELIEPLRSREAYSRFIVKNLVRHIDTSHVLLIQWDGHVVNPAAWQDAFLEYDYIGARWGWYQDAHRVGNGGFSLRSRRLLEALADPQIAECDPEDEAICRKYRPLLEDRYGIRFAPDEVADAFSFETTYPKSMPLGFHGLYNMWMFLPPEELEEFASRMTEATVRSIQYLQLAKNYRDLQRHEEAAILLRRRLAVAPDDAEARALMAPPAARPAAGTKRVGRNDPCPCGSGKRYKHCCGAEGAAASAPPPVAQLLQEAMQRHQAGHLYPAKALYEQVIALEPDNAIAEQYLGVLAMQHGDAREGERLIRNALARMPGVADFHNNLGLCLRAQDRLDEAIAAYRAAIAVDAAYAQGWNNLGLDLQQLGDVEGAVAAFERALALEPAFAEAHFNLSLVLLLTGEFRRGWAEYEWRERCARFAGDGLTRPQQRGIPPWRGEPLRDKVLLLRTEQGHGDAIQFIRYASVLAAQGAEVLLECAQGQNLAPLLATAPGVRQVLGPEQAPRADFYCNILSLPHRLDATLETIPADVPYLRADAGRMQTWRARLAKLAGRRAGVVWAGSPTHANDRNRSCPLSALAGLFELPGWSWVSLQKGGGREQLEGIGAARPVDWTDDLASFADTAALIAELDLVVTVDTAVAHLAGALGKPVWLLLPFAPDFRWLLGREDSPWYPTMRLFRQAQRRCWDEPVRAIAAAMSSGVTVAA